MPDFSVDARSELGSQLFTTLLASKRFATMARLVLKAFIDSAGLLSVRRLANVFDLIVTCLYLYARLCRRVVSCRRIFACESERSLKIRWRGPAATENLLGSSTTSYPEASYSLRDTSAVVDASKACYLVVKADEETKFLASKVFIGNF